MVWGRPFLKGHPKTGGRTKGTPNRKTVEKRLAEEQARKISSDLEPLDYMLEVMRDPTASSPRRDQKNGSEATTSAPICCRAMVVNAASSSGSLLALRTSISFLRERAAVCAALISISPLRWFGFMR